MELHTIAFQKLDITSCVYSYMIGVSLISNAMIVTYHNYIAGWAYARLIQLTAYPVLSQVYIVTTMMI